MKKAILPIILSAALLLSGCAKTTYGEEVKSDKPRLSSNASPTELSELVSANTEFAMDLYQLLKDGDDNIFYSPYSISAALAMTYGGAEGQTESQMADTLRFTLEQTRLHAAFNSLDTALNSRGQGAKGKDDEPFVLKVVNATWGQRDYTFQAAYLDLLAQNYSAGLRILDFIKSPEDSRQTINDWVAKETEQRIKDLLPQGSIDGLTRLVLTNAVYFNGGWLNPFPKEATRDGVFNLLNGQTVTVPMMFQSSSMSHAAGQGYQAAELKYDGGELSMVVIVPDTGAFANFEDNLDGAKLEQIISSLKNNTVNLTMPKFEFDSEFGLNAALETLGMKNAFNPDLADFSGMTGQRDLYISDVVHKAFVAVDEFGTEAAAATGVVVGTTSMPLDPATVVLDRPFIFLIRDIATGAVIFIGRVMNPLA